VLVTSATQRQIAEQFFGEVARHANRSGLPGTCLQTLLRVPGAALADGLPPGILGFTSDSATSYSGFHGARVCVILSEAQGIESAAWVGLESCGTGPDDRFITLGNPLFNAGRFFDCFQKPGWRTFQVSCYDHPNLRGGRFVAGGPSAAWIDKVRSDWGEASAVFQSRVLALFPEQGEESLWRRSWIDGAFRAGETGTLERHAQGKPLCFALDVARFGSDASALCVMQGPVVRGFTTWHGADTVQTVERLLHEVDRWAELAARMRTHPARRAGFGKPPHLIIDAGGGLGAGPVDMLQRHPVIRELRIPVDEFVGGSKAGDDAGYLNRRAQCYWESARLAEAGGLALPRNETVAEELLATSWKLTPRGQRQIEPKEELRARLGRSPDLADSLSMAVDVYGRQRATEAWASLAVWSREHAVW